MDGGNGDDTLRAGDGKDTLIGGAGDDRLFGGKGDDTFIGGPGNDFMQGGSGTHTADYSAETASVTVNLATHQATGASIGNDTLISIDNVIGGSADNSSSTVVARVAPATVSTARGVQILQCSTVIAAIIPS